ncbi:MAG: hypothetical protein QME66_09180, partial [Candidatus Eisenbacteria bacterium]|nr:hypothetical protein [Candidatus Eisenbacteria bacterium]
EGVGHDPLIPPGSVPYERPCNSSSYFWDGTLAASRIRLISSPKRDILLSDLPKTVSGMPHVLLLSWIDPY